MTESTDGRRPRRRRVLPWAVGGVVGAAMVWLAWVAVDRVVLGDDTDPDQAASVDDVASMSVVVAEDLDVLGGVELLCERPMDLYRNTVEYTITRWQNLAGGELPTVVAEVSDVSGGATGSFVIAIRNEGATSEQHTFRVFVETRDGRSCITGVGGPKARRATTSFSGDGYMDVTTPEPTPTPTPRPTRPAIPSATVTP
jgi:hypothetical protein